MGSAHDVGRRACPDAWAMDIKTTAISLELSLAGDSLTGSASDRDGHQRNFCGWLGLVSAIEALISPPDEEEAK